MDAAYKSKDCSGLMHAMTSTLVAVAILSAVTSVIHAVTDSDVGRTFILNPRYLTWPQARQSCLDDGGHLAKVDALHVIPELLYDEEWTLWIGLSVTSPNNMTWDDGSSVNWTNWFWDVRWPEEGSAACVTATTSPTFKWSMTSCNNTYPSVCEIPGGTCRFRVTEFASITGFNSNRTEGVNDTVCTDQCRSRRDIDCRSVEVHRHYRVCQFSNESRWTQPKKFVTGDNNWNYYHWTCVNGTYLNGVYVSPNGVEPHTTEATTEPPETTTPSTTTTTTTTTTTATTTTDEGEIVCAKVKPLPENTTEELEEVKELKTMGVTYQEQKKQKKKVSTSDPRPSATYVGSLAVGLVLGVLGIIVCLDLVSLPRHVHDMNRRGACCGRCTKQARKQRKEKRQKKIRFTEYSEGPPTGTRCGPLVLTTKVPHNFRPNGLVSDEHVENTYRNGNAISGDSSSGLGGSAVNSKIGLHLQRIKMLQEREFGHRRLGHPPPAIVPQVDDDDDVCDEEDDDEDVDEGFSGGGSSILEHQTHSSVPSRVVAFVEQEQEEGDDICRMERWPDTDEEGRGSAAGAVAGASGRKRSSSSTRQERNADNASSVCSADLRADCDDEEDDDDDEYLDAEGVVGELNAVVEMQRQVSAPPPPPPPPPHLHTNNQEVFKSTRVHALGGGSFTSDDAGFSRNATKNSWGHFDVFTPSDVVQPDVIPVRAAISRGLEETRFDENRYRNTDVSVVEPARVTNRLGSEEQTPGPSAFSQGDNMSAQVWRDEVDQDCLVDMETEGVVRVAETTSRQPDVEIRIEEAEPLAAEDAGTSRDGKVVQMDENRLQVQWSPNPAKNLQGVFHRDEASSNSRHAWFH